MIEYGVLRLASIIVPAERRVEWIAEWRTELWHVHRAGKNAIRFSVGSFRDALWMRKNTPGQSHVWLKSPGACMMFLGFLAALSLTVALSRAQGRALVGLTSLPNGCYGMDCVPIREARLIVVRFLGMSLLCAAVLVPTTTGLSLGSGNLRRWLFLFSKAALVGLVSFGMTLTGNWNHSPLVAVLLSQGALWSVVGGLRWVLEDQRSRCPVCLHRLEKPVALGKASRCLIEWECTEFVCLHGHGFLHVPGMSASWRGTQTWQPLDSSWQDLFPTNSK